MGGFITVAPSLGVSSCETSGSSSESERITGLSWVPDAKIRDRVIAEAGSRVLVQLDTFDGSREPTQGSCSRVPQVPK